LEIVGPGAPFSFKINLKIDHPKYGVLMKRQEVLSNLYNSSPTTLCKASSQNGSSAQISTHINPDDNNEAFNNKRHENTCIYSAQGRRPMDEPRQGQNAISRPFFPFASLLANKGTPKLGMPGISAVGMANGIVTLVFAGPKALPMWPIDKAKPAKKKGTSENQKLMR